MPHSDDLATEPSVKSTAGSLGLSTPILAKLLPALYHLWDYCASVSYDQRPESLTNGQEVVNLGVSLYDKRVPCVDVAKLRFSALRNTVRHNPASNCVD